MENNKIYICVKFKYWDAQIASTAIQEKEAICEHMLELYILRDATLKQLLYGIKYGLERRVNDDNTDHKEIYRQCRDLFRQYIDRTGNDNGSGDEYLWNLDAIRLENFDINTSKKYAGNDRIVISNAMRNVTAGDLNKPLYEIGFISSTQIRFYCMQNKVDVSGLDDNIDLNRIVPAFDPQTDPTPEVVFPQYNISTRIRHRFDESPVEIIPPNDPPAKSGQNIFFTLLPTVLSISAMLLLRGYMSGATQSATAGAMGGSNNSMLIMTAGMGLVTILTTLLSFWQQNRNYEKSLKEWQKQYEDYLNKLMLEIRTRQRNDTAELDRLYPNIEAYFSNPSEIKPIVYEAVYSRSHTDDDFLSVRIGTSDYVESKFPVNGAERKTVFSPAYFWLNGEMETENPLSGSKIPLSVSLHLNKKQEEIPSTNYLAALPGAVSRRFRYLSDAPLLYSLKNCGTLGVVCQSTSLSPHTYGYTNTLFFLERMIFDLCYYHSPENLQFVIFYKKTKNWQEMEKCTQMLKYMPHFHELFNKASQFVFDAESANLVLNNMLKIASEREEQKERANIPHIVVIVYEEYNMKEHAFARYLPTAPEDGKPYENKNGITFIFAKNYKEHLPSYCNHIINLDEENAELIDCENSAHKVPFTSDTLAYRKMQRNRSNQIMPKSQSQELRNAYQMLASLYYSQISQNKKVPSSVGMFSLYGVTSQDLGSHIRKNWVGDETGKRKYDVTSSLGVIIGKTELGSTVLDLHEKYDGPHMLVAGTTGSGKSETILSYLLGLCMQYRPDEVNLMLVDMKGGGFIKRIGMLPHVVGKVTDVDGDETNTGASYMLRRFLNALKSEIKKRKLLFNKMHVDSIDGYIKACRNIEQHILQEKIKEDEAEIMRKLAKEDKLAHLFLVVDEFTELKRFASENNDMDFIGEITTIARIGRSLGFHIILVSQNIEGAITDDIRINSKSRLCLKVATRQASKEMLGNELAADPSMPGNGRAYLLVGTGSKFEYFQSAYSGMSTQDDIEMPLEIVQVEMTGPYSDFYNSDRDNEKIIRRKKELKDKGELETQLKAIVRSICELDKAYRSLGEDAPYRKPHMVFQPPLGNRIVLENGKEIDLDQEDENRDGNE